MCYPKQEHFHPTKNTISSTQRRTGQVAKRRTGKIAAGLTSQQKSNVHAINRDNFSLFLITFITAGRTVWSE